MRSAAAADSPVNLLVEHGRVVLDEVLRELQDVAGGACAGGGQRDVDDVDAVSRGPRGNSLGLDHLLEGSRVRRGDEAHVDRDLALATDRPAPCAPAARRRSFGLQRERHPPPISSRKQACRPAACWKQAGAALLGVGGARPSPLGRTSSLSRRGLLATAAQLTATNGPPVRLGPGVGSRGRRSSLPVPALAREQDGGVGRGST